jgi:hypothetical protein
MTVPATALYVPPMPFFLAGGLTADDLRADFYHPGLGANQQTTQAIITGATSAASKAALAIMGPAAAGGPVGLAIGAAALAITALSGKIAHLITGCGQVCIDDTNIVNQADQLIQQIGSQYWNTAVRTVSFQQWTLQQLQDIFAQVSQKVGLQKSATERLTRGGGAPWCAANHLAIGVDNVVTPNPTNHFGRCGGWLDVVYDPLASDPDVVPDSAAVGQAVSAAASSIGLVRADGTLNWGMVALVGVGLVLLMSFAL